MTQDLRIALILAGVSQVALAARLGLHASTLSRIVNGWLVPPLEVQASIRRALGRHGRDIRFGRGPQALERNRAAGG